MKKRRLLFVLVIAVLAIAFSLFLLFRLNNKASAPSDDSAQITDLASESNDVSNNTAASPEPQPETTPTNNWPVVWSLEEASSVTLVVNKKHKLPEGYVPELKAVGLRGNGTPLMRSDVVQPMADLFRGAADAGHQLFIISAYRSYQSQVSTYNGYVSQYGQDAADTFSARPGFSEHQTGLAADIGLTSGQCSLDECFGETAAGQWLAANAAKYGFIIRYQEGKDEITGYHYEPWHIRYIGKEAAEKVYASGKTYEEYTGMEGGDYAVN